MATKPIGFGPAQASGLEQVAGASPSAFNVVIEASGAVRRRPGIAAIAEAPSTVVDSDGIALLHLTEDGDIVAVSSPSPASAKIYRIRGGAALDISPTAPRSLLGSRRPTLVETEMLLVLAAGDVPQKVTLADWQSSRLGGSPPAATHVINNGLRLQLNDVVESKTGVRYSEPAIGLLTYAGHEVWSGGNAGSFTAESRPDPIVALHDTAGEIFVFGSKTLEVWGPGDATFPFVPVLTLENGCIAPYSVIDAGDQFFWLDDNKTLVGSNGRQVRVLSEAIAQNLTDIATFDDCFGFRVQHGRIDCACWTFPTDGRTYVLQKNGGWAQWASWQNGNYAPLSILCTHNAKGRCFVGTADGHVGEMLASATTDLGSPIAAYATTGFENRGTDALKQCQVVRLALRHEAGSQGLCWLDWRDDLGDWNSVPVELDGGSRSLTEVEWRGLGAYRRRQWRIRFDGTAEVVLALAEEQFSVVQ